MEDLPPEKQPHVDEQTALENPQRPGASKEENLRRIDRQLRTQRARRRNSTGRDEPTEKQEDVLGSSREELYERARKLGVEGRSRMTKSQLAEAIARRQ
jgi:hypothetical protein